MARCLVIIFFMTDPNRTALEQAVAGLGRAGNALLLTAQALAEVFPPAEPPPPPPPPPPPVGDKADVRAALGAWPGSGNQVTKLRAFERFLGRSVRHATQNVGYHVRPGKNELLANSWGHWKGDQENEALGLLLPNVTSWTTWPLAFAKDVPTVDRLPLSQTEVRRRLTQTANGEHDHLYRKAAEYVRSAAAGPRTVIRLGHEPDIRHYPWSVVGAERNPPAANAEAYVAAWRHVSGLLRAEIPGVRFCLNFNGSVSTELAEEIWPGDDVVDFVGQDSYARRPWPEAVRRLDTAFDLAVEHSKPFCIPEWGLYHPSKNGSGDDPDWIDAMADWLADRPAAGPGALAMHGYFDGNRYACLSGGQYPRAAERFIARFA